MRKPFLKCLLVTRFLLRTRNPRIPQSFKSHTTVYKADTDTNKSICFFQFPLLQSYILCGLSMLSSIKCTSENAEYTIEYITRTLRFFSAACIYNLAVLLIYSDLTQLSERTQHKYTKPLRRRISCERVISVFVTQEQRVLRKIVIFII